MALLAIVKKQKRPGRWQLLLLCNVALALLGCSAPAVERSPVPATANPTPLPVTEPPPPTLVTPSLAPTNTTIAPTAIPAILLPSPELPTASAIPTVMTAGERRQIFDEVWNTVASEYLYADFHGVDWEALYVEYLPRIEADQSKEAFYATLVEMVGQLGDNHSRFVPPSAAQAEDASASGREMTVGIGVLVRPKHDGAFIQIVFPDSPAARSDLRPRDRIIAVDGRPYRIEDGDLQGALGSEVRLTVVRPGEKLRDIVLVRQEVQSRILPYYRRFPGDIGYVSVPTLWASDMGEQVSGALTDLVASGDLRGVILDVRANRGGWGEVLNDVLSHFVRGQVGVFFGRNHARPFVVAPPAGPDLRQVELVVLIDSDTASYAEVLAAVLQHEAGAQVVGTRSAGNTETIYAHSFQDGSRLWLAQEGFRLQDGTNLEGDGVHPDVEVDIDWTRFSEDDDPQLLEALRLLGGGPK